MSFVLSQTQLTPRAVDALLPDFLCCLSEAEGAEELEIDLGDLEFIPPYGLVALCLMARYARIAFPRVTYRLPRLLSLRRYLGRVRFAQALAGVAEPAGPGVLVDQEREKPESEALLELTRIEERVDVERVLAHIGQRVEAILAEELHYAEVEIGQFKNVVAELGHNILDHSMNWGYVTAQRYQDPRTREKYAVIGVGDLGIGIKKSLAERFEVSAWTHGQAILNSLKKYCSRDPARGLGLYIVSRICSQYRGNLQIRSGDTRIYIRGSRHDQHLSCFFPGTLLGITLCQQTRRKAGAGPFSGGKSIVR